MSRILVAYGTIEGHTQMVAQRVCDGIRGEGHEAILMDPAIDEPLQLEAGEYEGVVICAPVHGGQHPATIVNFMQENRVSLERVPTALLSVSLSAAFREGHFQSEARSYVDELIRLTGVTPSDVLLVAGALRYTQYSYLKRLVMRLIAERNGGDADTTRDWVYTDWEALDAFVRGFAAKVTHPAVA